MNRSKSLIRHAVGEFPRTRLAYAVTLAISAFIAPDAYSANCPNTLGTRLESTCTLPAGSDLRVTGHGEIEVTDGPAVLIDHTQSASNTLINSGRLAGSSAAILLQGSDVIGDIRNNRTGILETPDGVLDEQNAAVRLDSSALQGSIVNAGSINADDAYGIYLNDSQVTGDIRNSGDITADTGIGFDNVDLGGDLRNSGTITALYNDGVIINDSRIAGSVLNFGTISGGDHWGLHITDSRITGDVINTGDIVAGSFPIGAARFANTLIDGNLINTGHLDSSSLGTGLVVYGGEIRGDFINRNQITGNNAMSVNAVTIGGDLRNSGTIAGQFNPDGGGAGWNSTGTTIHGNVLNSGSIEAATTAVRLDGSTIDGRFYNSGRIEGDLAIELAGTTTLASGLSNSGVIQGSDYALKVGDGAQLDNVYIAGNDSAVFVGEVYAPRTTVTLFSDATYTLQDGNLFTVDQFVNRGVLGVAATNAVGESAKATIAGDYRQTADAVFRTHVLDSTHYGQLVVTGTARLPSDARIDVDVANANEPFTTRRLQDVISAGTLKSDGTFAVTSNSALFDFGAVKDGNSVDLTLTAKSADGVAAAARGAGLSSGEGVAKVVDQQLALGSASALTPYFVSATNAGEVASSLAQTLPLSNDTLRASQMAMSSISNAVQERLTAPSPQQTLDSHDPSPSALWSKPFSYSAGHDQGSTMGGASGTVIGIDARTSSTSRAGLAFAYADGGTGRVTDGSQQSTRLGLWQFMGYSSHNLDEDTSLMVYAGAGQNSTDGERSLAISGLRGTARADYDSLFATAGTSIGKVIPLGEHSRLMPSVRVDYTRIHENGYSEHGPGSLAPLMLEVDSRETDQLIAGLDGRFEHAFSGDTWVKVNLGVGYDLINEDGTLRASFAGAPGMHFSVPTRTPNPWLIRGGFGFATKLGDATELSLDYAAQTRDGFDDQSASVNMRVPF